MDSLHADLSSLKEEMKALREGNTNFLARPARVEQMSQALSKTVTTMETKLAEMEDWNRRNKIVVDGLSEQMENANALQYITAQLSLWSPTLKDTPLEIMRAYCIGSLQNQGS